MAKTLPTSIRLNAETKDRLQRFGKERGWSVSKIIEHVIQEWLNFQDKEKRDQPWRK